MFNDKRIRIIVGHYGSGKTEFAVNYAMKLSETEDNVALADLDVVNVYFRSREKAQLMTDAGIKVISSQFGHGANLDLPAISAGVFGPLQDDNCHTILDIGGDSTGTRVLGTFKQIIGFKGYDMFLVVNAYRQDTQTKEGVIKHIEEIENQTGFKITGLVNNTHLLRETTLEDVKKGQELVKSVSESTNIPIKYICAIEKVAQTIPSDYDGEIMPIKMYMREEWM
ncbi:ATP-binding protein [Acidaminobacter sp. JC074]|uniref:ATP-binding protein n=1 Tax=Acidaminobacter sp. JC074 TaxID=2530199 RepID=UPI001F0D6789|nr:ATP-binding protein [Acidaminobacter sp. JC074]MCH4889992.1 ATP-binding protein [Acidaminobacter sp. JC074]